MEGAAGPRKLSEGTMLDDKYRIERLLALGGMGAVYEGTHIKLRKRVAIKILNPQLSSPPMVERFHREAITASQIGHEGIAQVTDLGTSTHGEPFLVMEYLDGESLASRLRSVGRFAIQQACELALAILSPLAAAHQAGIVHRDLKPDNVFLARQSRGEMVKLLDFGISRATSLESEFRLTTTGLVLGTPYYMSPEQARGDSEVTTAADLYAFGVMLYEMLIGQVPIQADNYNQLLYRVMMSDFPRPREHRPELPEALEQLILAAMAQHPADRPASAHDLERALLPFCRPQVRDHVLGGLSSPAQPSHAPSPSARGLGSGPQTLVPTSGGAAAGSPRDRVVDSPGVRTSGGAAAGSPRDRVVDSPGVRTGTQNGTQIAGPGAPGAAVGGAVTQPERPGALGHATPGAAGRPRASRAPWLIVGLLVAGGIATAAVALRTSGSVPGSPRDRAVDSPGLRSAPAVPVGAVADSPVAAPPEQPALGIDAAVAIVEPPAVPVVPPAAVPEVAPARVTLRFAVVPASARITIDGAAVATGDVVVDKDDHSHALRITAPGYRAHEDTVRFDENQRLVVQLRRVSEPARKEPRRPPVPSERIESDSPYQ